MHTAPSVSPLYDLHPALGDFRQDVVTGLTTQPKRLPSMYFYDQEGSILFDQICDLEEYYPTRTEVDILSTHGEEMANLMGEQTMLVELGSGSSIKTRILLERFSGVHSYVPVDISRDHLLDAAKRVASAFPHIPVRPVCADFMSELRLPPAATAPRRKYVLFPGSTIGNFHPDQRRELLRRIAALCSPEGGGLLLGIDLQKDVSTLESAYNDARGVTADFNLNLLRRINRELDGNFELSRFEHRAFYNRNAARIEMHLVSQESQAVRIGDRAVSFTKGESICTEYSYKFSVQDFQELAKECGLGLRKCWTDPQELFAVLLLEVEQEG